MFGAFHIKSKQQQECCQDFNPNHIKTLRKALELWPQDWFRVLDLPLHNYSSAWGMQLLLLPVASSAAQGAQWGSRKAGALRHCSTTQSTWTLLTPLFSAKEPLSLKIPYFIQFFREKRSCQLQDSEQFCLKHLYSWATW